MFKNIFKFMSKKDIVIVKEVDNKVVNVVYKRNTHNIINYIAGYKPEEKVEHSNIFILKASLPSQLLIKAEESHIIATGMSIKLPLNCYGILMLKVDGLILQGGIAVLTPNDTNEIKIHVKNPSNQKRVTIQNNQVIAELFIINNSYTNSFVQVKRFDSEVTK